MAKKPDNRDPYKRWLSRQMQNARRRVERARKRSEKQLLQVRANTAEYERIQAEIKELSAKQKELTTRGRTIEQSERLLRRETKPEQAETFFASGQNRATEQYLMRIMEGRKSVPAGASVAGMTANDVNAFFAVTQDFWDRPDATGRSAPRSQRMSLILRGINERYGISLTTYAEAIQWVRTTEQFKKTIASSGRRGHVDSTDDLNVMDIEGEPKYQVAYRL